MTDKPSARAIAAANRLAGNPSPYLEQHAGNPVHWQPWDAAALALAREHDVPILLSIGYAACHWCHVMEHESFADPAIARLMNENFVCVKVDREERPDLDKTFQAAHFMLSRQSGGWPLTVFCAPNLVPFFTGTYFPPAARGNLLGLPDIIQRVREVWDTRRADVTKQNATLAQALLTIDSGATGSQVPPVAVLATIRQQLAAGFDKVNGGLGKAPKFPQAPALQCALHLHRAGAPELGQGLEHTLDVMAAGGLHDHVGGGFFRYCVDPTWDIPHFEKMHYDNAQLVRLYAESSVAFDRPDLAAVAAAAADWMLGSLRDDDGGILSAWDADSEGKEGSYYVWRAAQLDDALGADGRATLDASFTTGGAPNFEGAHHLRQPAGRKYRLPDEATAAALGLLRQARRNRPPPAIDDKVLANACGLAARGLARAGMILGRDDLVAAARAAVAHADGKLVVDGQLRAFARGGATAGVAAFLDDHACLLQARLALLEDACTPAAVAAAARHADEVVRLFDDGQGGLLFVAVGQEQVLRRIRVADDGPQPAGNGIMVQCLLQLGWMLGRPSWLDLAGRILRGFAEPLASAPIHSPTMAVALDWFHHPPPLVVLTGEPQAVRDWATQLARHPGPERIVMPLGEATGHEPALTKPQPPACTPVWAHVCRGNTCAAPVDDLERLLAELAQRSPPLADAATNDAG